MHTRACFYRPTGDLQVPLVTLHNTLDPMPFKHESNYARVVGAAGASESLTVLPVEDYGHCNFTSQRIFAVLVLALQ